MSVLFFDGFDRYTILKDLDPNYWSFEPQQPVEYEKYAFGGYSYNHGEDYYPGFSYYDDGLGAGYYNYYSPNNGVLPTGTYQSSLYIGAYTADSGNHYPGFGSPPGFLALTNLDISDTNMLAPITYLQLSGFTLPTGDSSFLTTRILGLETKDTNYASSDKPGRFDHKHPLVAFCSGNVTGLILNVVKTTGNHLELIENQLMTMGLEVEQTDGVSGTFDLNISNDLNEYNIRSVFGGRFDGFDNADGLSEETNGSGLTGRILTIDADHQKYQFSTPSTDKAGPTSRWCHFQFGIVGTGSVPYMQIKLEDIDLLSIPDDDTITDKDLWSDKIYISGFNYDNIRFFNRTYNGSLGFKTTRCVSSYSTTTCYDFNMDSVYYMKGAVTLIDDVILSDNTENTSTFLGKNAKVVPFVPGVAGYITDAGGIPDGYNSGIQEWSTNSSSTRVALKNLDGDTGKISTSTSGAISSVPYRPYSNNLGTPDDGSLERLGSVEDSIGGIKFYSQAKKEFLDTTYIPVAYTGNADPLQTGVYLMLNFENNTDTILDSTRNKWPFAKSGEIVTDEFKIDNASLQLRSGEFIKSNISPKAVGIYNNRIYHYPELGIMNSNGYSSPTPQDFTLECWVKFTGLHETLTLFSKNYENLPFEQRSSTNSDGAGSAISYDLTINTGSLSYTRRLEWLGYSDQAYYNTGELILHFPELINDNDWHHISLNNSTTGLIVFLDGISGVNYELDLSLVASPGYDKVGFGAGQAYSRTGTNELFYWETATASAKGFDNSVNHIYTTYYQKSIPAAISGNGYIDGFRINKPSLRYDSNYTPPTTMKGELDNYIEIGDEQILSKTRYGKVYQFYEYVNPVDNLPWSTGWVNHPSGFILGVKKT